MKDWTGGNRSVWSTNGASNHVAGVTFLEGKARRREIFDRTPPRTLYVFFDRMLCAKNGDFEKMRETTGGAVAYGWYVWEHSYRGETVIKWI